MHQAWTIAKELQCTRNALPRKETILKKRESRNNSCSTTAVVWRAMVETWENGDEDSVFVFGDEVSADLQRRETHSCKESGASRSACPFGSACELTTRGTTPPIFSIDGSSIEQSHYKKVHWRKSDAVGEMKEMEFTMVESNVLIPVASLLSL